MPQEISIFMFLCKTDTYVIVNHPSYSVQKCGTTPIKTIIFKSNYNTNIQLRIFS